MNTLRKIVDTLDRIATPRNLLVAIMTSAVVVTVMGIGTRTYVYDIFGDVTMPDTRLWYTYEELVLVFNTLGAEGLQVWSQVHLLDLIFPLGYSFSLTFGILLELRRAYPENRKLRILGLLPLMAAFADFAENTIIASQIAVYPNLSQPIIAIASLVTTTKWIILGFSFAVVFILLVVVGYKIVTKK